MDIISCWKHSTARRWARLAFEPAGLRARRVAGRAACWRKEGGRRRETGRPKSPPGRPPQAMPVGPGCSLKRFSRIPSTPRSSCSGRARAATAFRRGDRVLPRPNRWDVEFSTFFATLPPGVTCSWRGVIDGSPEAEAALRLPARRFINLCRSNERASGGDSCSRRARQAPTGCRRW